LSLFEYLAAGYILMLSFAVLRAISGVPHATRYPRRYWVHLSWLSTALATCFVSFWAFWSYREVDWTVLQFMNALAIPTLQYAYISLLVPPDPSAVESWREYFFDIRARLFFIGAVFTVFVAISNQTSLGISPLHPSQLGNYAVVAMYAIGSCSANEKLHTALAFAFPCFVLAYILTLMAEPDSLFREIP
jgi:hypothetical protein